MADMWVTGIDELDALFKEAIPKMQKQIVRKATRAVAKDVLADAKARAPHDTGLLESSLVVRSAKITNKRRRGIEGHSVETKDGLFRGETFYGAFVELGHKTRSGSTVAEDSYLRYAIYTQKDRRRAIFANVMIDEIKRTLVPMKNSPSTVLS